MNELATHAETLPEARERASTDSGPLVNSSSTSGKATYISSLTWPTSIPEARYPDQAPATEGTTPVNVTGSVAPPAEVPPSAPTAPA